MRLGFIGLGIMGGAMAANLLKAKWEVAVHDVRPEAAEPLLAMGADWADSPAAMAEPCDIVFSCLPDFSAIESVRRCNFLRDVAESPPPGHCQYPPRPSPRL